MVITEGINQIIDSHMNIGEFFGYVLSGVILLILLIRIILDDNLNEVDKLFNLKKYMYYNCIGSTILGILLFLSIMNSEYKYGFEEIEILDKYMSQNYKPETYVKFKEDNLNSMIRDAILDNKISIYEWCLIKSGYKIVFENIYNPAIVKPTQEEIQVQKDRVKEKYQNNQNKGKENE